MVKGVMEKHPEPVRVAVAIVLRDGRFLVGQRHPNTHLGGLWEFPGGKSEPGESPAQTAMRELKEECNVDAAVVRVLAPMRHQYTDRIIELTPVLCDWQNGEGEPIGTETCRWFTLDELRTLPMPQMNGEILDAISSFRSSH